MIKKSGIRLKGVAAFPNQVEQHGSPFRAGDVGATKQNVVVLNGVIAIDTM
jgi:hypothetical protein